MNNEESSERLEPRIKIRIARLKQDCAKDFARARQFFFEGKAIGSKAYLSKWYISLRKLAELQGEPNPPLPKSPEFYFKDDNDDNSQSAPVPRNPYPGIDGKEIKMLLPKEDG